MFSFAILIGIYSYLILALGLLGILYKQSVFLLTLSYLVVVIFILMRPPRRSPSPRLRSGRVGHLRGVYNKQQKINIVLISILVMQATANLIGALGPDLGFDALWYHLTIPKLYLENHSIFYIPGGLLYYSMMPKLTEMLYISTLALNGEILAKLVHYSFGILTCIALYKLSREFFSKQISLIAVVVFYSNLVVGWQSITAYVDLARTFFELMALWGFVKFWKIGEGKWLIISAVMLGLAISTKLLALGSLLIFSILIIIQWFFFAKNSPRRSHGFSFGFAQDQPATIRGVSTIWLLVYWVIGLLVPLPWFVFSYINTGNPIYPFFTDLYGVGFSTELLNPFRFVGDVWGMFTKSSDPISPIYVIFLPLVILFFFRHLRDSGRASLARMTELKIIAAYSLFAIIIWYITPRTGGGRFILPYLPAFSILAAGVIERLNPPRRSREVRNLAMKQFSNLAMKSSRKTREINLRNWCIGLVVFVSIVSLFYRGIANSKYIPVIFGLQSKEEFLSSNLNFSYGDFYDTDGYFKKYIKSTDNVLLYGFHNLYYVNFPFVDSSWVKKGDSFNFVAVQNAKLPKKFKDWNLIYLNPKTHVELFSKGGIKWPY